MADVQGSSGAGGDDRPPPRDPRKGKDLASQKPKKKKVKRGGLDDWETTLAIALLMPLSVVHRPLSFIFETRPDL